MPYVVPMRLEADGLTTLEFNPGLHNVAFIDLGDPQVRVVAQNAPDANGMIDTSQFFGERVVTLSVVVAPDGSSGSMWEQRTKLRAFTRPDLRPKLYLQIEEGAPEIVLTLRGAAWSDPWSAPFQRKATISVQWVCPSGLLESAELHSVTAGAGGYEEQPGRAYDLTFDRSYPAADPSSGGALCVNDGNVPVWPTIYMFGPASNGIVLRNDTYDVELTFVTTLSIAAGDWLKVDFAQKTIVNSTGTSYYDSLDFAASTWWQLQPGENRVFMIPDTFSGAASVQVDYRDGWL